MIEMPNSAAQITLPSRENCNYVFEIFDKVLSEYPDWFRPYISQDFCDCSIEYSNRGNSVKVQLDHAANGMMIGQLTENDKVIAHELLTSKKDTESLATKVFDHMVFGDPLVKLRINNLS